MAKVKHDIICQDCGKVATINLSNEWRKFLIDNNGDYEETSECWTGESSIDLCEECYDGGKGIR